MNSFFNILQTMTNKNNKTYPDHPFTLITRLETNNYTNENYYIDFLIKTMYYEERKYKYVDPITRMAKAKFNSLSFIIDIFFQNNELKERIITIFSKSQKCYYAFSRLARIYKNNKYPIIVHNDLMLNPLNINNKNTFILIENKCKYLFSLNDLVLIVETAISNSPNFFSYPLSPLNPYNNEPFTYSTLYNIYFMLKESGRLMSILFHLYFLENFNKNKFVENNEPVIRDIAIKQYIYNSPYTVLHIFVLIMLKSNPYTQKYKIHKDFPKDKLVSIFRPFLYYYFIINYDIKDTVKINNYKQILYIKLTNFYKYNKAFGRQYIKITTCLCKIIKKEILYNDKHITFYNIPIKKENSYNELMVVGITSTINILTNIPVLNNNILFEEDGDEEDEDDINEDDEDDVNVNVNVNVNEDDVNEEDEEYFDEEEEEYFDEEEEEEYFDEEEEEEDE